MCSFLGGLTGRAGLAQLSDTFVSDPHLFFREGQSVRATVVQVRNKSLGIVMGNSIAITPPATERKGHGCLL